MRTRLLFGAGSLIGGAALATSLMGAGNALADSSPVTASVAVPSTVTLTGVSPSITFPETPNGSTANATGAESYVVETNDSAGYTLTLGSGAKQFASGPNSIPDQGNLQIMETGFHPGQATLLQLVVGNPVTLNQTNAPATGDHYTEDWSLAIPSGQASGNYSQAFTYTATGN